MNVPNLLPDWLRWADPSKGFPWMRVLGSAVVSMDKVLALAMYEKGDAIRYLRWDGFVDPGLSNRCPHLYFTLCFGFRVF